MSKVGSANITNQPRFHDIHNSFALMGNEKFLHEYKVEEGSCGCGSIYYTSLTNARLLIRSESKSCCSCGKKSDHIDISIFLRDVVEVREAMSTRHCCSSCITCCSSSKRSSNLVEVRGVFGSHILHIAGDDMQHLQIELPAAVANHKLVSRR